MPVSVVVGGQFGSEGKGKVALELARLRNASAAIRVGGPNSGHTAVDATGQAHVFRHLPTAALLPNVVCVIGAGSYIDPDVLLDEIARIQLSSSRVLVDPWAVLIEPKHRERERHSRLRERIGSTLSGTGAAVAARVQREADLHFAKDEPRLGAFVRPVKPWLRARLQMCERIIIEGTQGFGLSLLHSEHYPHATSRDTTAAAFVAEAGLSPLDVDEIAMVIRAFPIRVDGASGHLPHETSWQAIAQQSGNLSNLSERTSVTQRVRRVANFDPRVVSQAIDVNLPSLICLNHLDHIEACAAQREWTPRAQRFVCDVEASIRRQIDYVGIGPADVVSRRVVPSGWSSNERVAS